MSKTSEDKKNVVVVGGGAAGIPIARGLSAKLDASKYNLILVNPRTYSIHMLAGARLTTSDVDHLEDTAFIPYDQLFSNGHGSLKVGKVTAIDASKGSQGGVLTLQDGQKLPYEILVLTPGSTWSGAVAFPDDKDAVTEWLKQWRAKYAKANHIVLAGGGAVGIESAGEIKDQFPNKKVTIVHGDDMLVNKTYPDKFRLALDKSLRARGVEIVYNDFVDDVPAEGVVGVTTRNGKKLDADLVVLTTGPRPNTSFISTLGPDALTDRGTVRVNPTLQLVSHPDIYAAGDVIDWAEQKQAAKAGAHAAVIIANILSAVAGKTPTTQYKGSLELIVITNGKAGGAAYFDVLWGILLGAWFVKMIKGKDLLVPMGRKGAGLA